VATGTLLKARAADISLEGCYIDTMNPYPEETLVRVKIKRNGTEFISSGAVRNSQVGMGMGITFAELGTLDKTLLKQWIHETDSAPSAPKHSAPAEPEAPQKSEMLTRRLIALLRKKGQLTAVEEEDILSGKPTDIVDRAF